MLARMHARQGQEPSPKHASVAPVIGQEGERVPGPRVGARGVKQATRSCGRQAPRTTNCRSASSPCQARQRQRHPRRLARAPSLCPHQIPKQAPAA